MHGLNLGCQQHANGTTLVFICDPPGATLQDYALNLEHMYNEFKHFCSENKIDCSLPEFTPANVSRESREHFPMHKCKAANGKVVSNFLAKKTFDMHMLAPDDEPLREVAVLMWGLADFQIGMDEYEMFLSDDEAARLYHAGRTFLYTYHMLAVKAFRNNVNMWLIVPKFHYLAHLVMDLPKDLVNPRFYHCFGDEDFVGKIAAIGHRVHRARNADRTIDRYLIALFDVWETYKATHRDLGRDRAIAAAEAQAGGRPRKRRRVAH
jgi:hypothetical protein